MTDIKTQDPFEIFPHGVTVGLDSSRPVLIFRGKDRERVVPVYLSQLEAGIAITQDHSRQAPQSPHRLARMALEMLGVKPARCTFVELRGHHQYVEVNFEGSEQLHKIRLRADQAVSFCLHASVPFFCSVEFFEQCRRLPFVQFDLHGGPNVHPYLN
jgi:bifunctional DNase/RNase